MTVDKKQQGNRLRALRYKRGQTLQSLAREAGTTYQTIEKMENGKMAISTKWIGRLAGPLGTKPGALYEYIYHDDDGLGLLDKAGK